MAINVTPMAADQQGFLFKTLSDMIVPPRLKPINLGIAYDTGMSGLLLCAASGRCDALLPTAVRTLASKFQTEPFNRLGATPVVMTLGDVLPALQQGTIDGSIGSIVIFTPMRFQDAAKFVTETGQPAVFVAVEISKRWFDTLPADLQKILDENAAKEAVALQPPMVELYNNARKGWTDAGGELISLPPDEQASMMRTLSSVGADVSNANPTLSEAYKAVTAGAERTR
jgi:TRAP-type transport system periplasmic protein